MINFFRKTRKQLAAENKPKKYLRYAIGEIALVVIGILVALQINSWNTNRINRQLELKYLHNMVEDLNFESRTFERSVLNKFQNKIEGLQLASKYAMGLVKVKDTIDFMNRVGYGAVYSRGANVIYNTTLQELISTGNFGIIQNETIKKDILSYYAKREFLPKYADNLRTEYASYIHAVRPFNPQYIEHSDSLNFKRALINFKKEEFLNLVNQELTFGYSVKYRVEELNHIAKELIKKLNEEINKAND